MDRKKTPSLVMLIDRGVLSYCMLEIRYLVPRETKGIFTKFVAMHNLRYINFRRWPN